MFCCFSIFFIHEYWKKLRLLFVQTNWANRISVLNNIDGSLFFPGLVGILMVPFFEFEHGVFWNGSSSDPWQKLGVNIAGGLAIVVWSALWSVVIFGILKATKLLRIDREMEFQGIDAVKHGESYWPIFWKPYLPSSTGRSCPNKLYRAGSRIFVFLLCCLWLITLKLKVEFGNISVPKNYYCYDNTMQKIDEKTWQIFKWKLLTQW